MFPTPPRAIIFDFDGVILDSAGIKVEAYVTIYAGEDPEKVKELVHHAHLHGGTTRRVKFAQYERELFGRSGDLESVGSLPSCGPSSKQFEAEIAEAMKEQDLDG